MKRSIFELSRRKLKKVEKAYKKTAFGKLTERATTLTFIFILGTWLCELIFNKICNKNLQLDEIDFTGLFFAFATFGIYRLIQLKFIQDFYNEKYSQRKINEKYLPRNNNEKYGKNKRKWH